MNFSYVSVYVWNLPMIVDTHCVNLLPKFLNEKSNHVLTPQKHKWNKETQSITSTATTTTRVHLEILHNLKSKLTCNKN